MPINNTLRSGDYSFGLDRWLGLVELSFLLGTGRGFSGSGVYDMLISGIGHVQSLRLLGYGSLERSLGR